MKSEERQKHIQELLARKGVLRSNEIIQLLAFSPATVRRDLAIMEQEGVIRRTRGRIVLQARERVPAFDVREAIFDNEKSAIGKAAMSLVNEGDSIIIDSGTTPLALAGCLRGFQRLSVITNSVPVAYMFNGTAVSTFLCGGMVDDMALIDEDALAYFSTRWVDKVFLGATGVRGTEGLTVCSSYQIAIKRKMLESAEEAYVLIDSSKFDFRGISMFADFSELTGVVTSKPIQNEALLERFDKLGLKVVYAEDTLP